MRQRLKQIEKPAFFRSWQVRRSSAPAEWQESQIRASDRNLDYWLYIPKRLARKPALVVMLHGCRQTAQEFANTTDMAMLADRHGFLLVFPQQNLTANPLRCWNWFDPRNQGQEGEAGLIMRLIEELRGAHDIAPKRVFVAGLSAGGAMAALLGRSCPDKIGAIGVHSGVPAGAAENITAAMEAMKTGGTGQRGPGHTLTIVFQGMSDGTVVPANGDRIAFASTPSQGRKMHVGQRTCRRFVIEGSAQHAAIEYWQVNDLGHAWSGGQAGGSYADPLGPNASTEMIRFFLGYPRAIYPLVVAWLDIARVFGLR